MSGIIICFNGIRFLAEAIQSVLSQTYDDWELLLVDDGSTDGSDSLAREFVERMPDRIHYVEHDGHRQLGMAASRNLGIRAARGQYIAFLDSDDIWLPEKVAQQVVMLEGAPAAAMIYGRTLAWYSWGEEGERLGTDHLRELGVRPNRVVQPPELLMLALRNGGPLPSNSNAMWRRSIVDDVGAFDESFRAAYSDVPFYVKLLRRYPVLVTSQCWDRYRQHPDNAVRRSLESGDWHPVEPNRARAQLLQWVRNYFQSVGESRAEVCALLDHESCAYDHPRPNAIAPWLRPTSTPDTGLSRGSLTWDSIGVGAIEVRVNAPDGPLLSIGGPKGEATTGTWVRDGTTFFLQDVTDRLPLDPANTLAAATAWFPQDTNVVETGYFVISGWSRTAESVEPLAVSWVAPDGADVEIRQDRPDGRLLARSPVDDLLLDCTMPTALLMQNVTARLPLTRDNTLCRLDVRRRGNRMSLRHGRLSLRTDPRGFGESTPTLHV